MGVLTAAPCLYPDPSERAKPNAGELTMESWEYYVDLLKPAGKLFETSAAPATEQLRGAIYRQLTMNIAQGSKYVPSEILKEIEMAERG